MNAFLAVVAVLGVSASGPLMAAAAAPVLAIAFWRNAAAAAVLTPFALRDSRAELGALGRRGWATAAFAGVMLAGHFTAWVSSLKLTSVAAATALVTTQIVWVVLVDRLRGQVPTRAVLTGVAVAVAGVAVISGVDLSVSSRALAGDACAVAGGLFAALYLVAGSSVRRSLSTTAYTTVCYGICALVVAAACAAGRVPVGGFGAKAWLLIAAVTVCAQLLGHSLINHLLAAMSPMLLSLLLLLEVPGAAILAGVFLGQSPDVGVYVGLALILSGLAVVTLARPADEEPPAGVA